MRLGSRIVACALGAISAMVSACGGDDGDGGHVHEIEIPAGHPRLWFSTPNLLDQAKQKFAAMYGADGANYKPDDEDPQQLAFGYLMTHNKTWGDKAIAWALTIEDSKIDDPDPGASVSDPYRFFGENVALVYDWCHDDLTDDQKSQLIGRWNEYVTNENLRTFGGLQMQSNNYYWGHLRNSLEWGIVTSGENDAAPGFVAEALDDRWTGSFLPFAAAGGYGAGGVPQEGTQYGQYNLGYPVIPFATATALGRDIYKETDFFYGSVLYLAYGSTPAKTQLHGGDGGYQMYGFDDDERWKDGGTASKYGEFLQNVAVHYHDTPIGKLARHLIDQYEPPVADWAGVLDQRFDNDDMDPSFLPLDYYAPGPGYLYARNAWGETATTSFYQLGQPSGVGHHHQDWGTWQLWRNGRWLSRESTSYDDTVVGWGGDGVASGADTIAHNGILFEGIGTNSYWFDDPHMNTTDGPPKVLRLESKDAYTYAAVDLSGSFRAHGSTHINNDNTLRDDNAHVKTIVREFVFVKELEALVVFDRLESQAFDRQDAESENGVTIVPHVDDASAVRKTFIAHFEESPTISGNVASASYGNQTMKVITAYPTSGVSAKVVDETGSGGSAAGQFRLEVTTSGSAQSYFVHVMGGVDAGAADLTAQATEDGSSITLTVARGGTPVTIKFAKGMASTGGSFNGGGFTDRVQGIKVDVNGAHWQ